MAFSKTTGHVKRAGSLYNWSFHSSNYDRGAVLF